MKDLSGIIAVVFSACALMPHAVQGIEQGSEFGAKIVVVRENPLDASVSFTPTIDMRNVVVEVPNHAGGSLIQCTYPSVATGKMYTCQIAATADSRTTGLVVALAGDVGALGSTMQIRKVFTVRNPSYDSAQTRAAEREAHQRKGRLQQDEARKK